MRHFPHVQVKCLASITNSYVTKLELQPLGQEISLLFVRGETISLNCVILSNDVVKEHMIRRMNEISSNEITKNIYYILDMNKNVRGK